jgi:hypothetical protein
LSSNDVSRDLDDFRRFMLLSLFRLRLYKTFEENKPVYCVGLVARCGEPEGWIVVWRRCYEEVNKAVELYHAVEPIARNRLGNLLIMEAYHRPPEQPPD